MITLFAFYSIFDIVQQLYINEITKLVKDFYENQILRRWRIFLKFRNAQQKVENLQGEDAIILESSESEIDFEDTQRPDLTRLNLIDMYEAASKTNEMYIVGCV